MCRSRAPPGLTHSLHVRHLTLARRFGEVESEPCPLPSPFSPSSLALTTSRSCRRHAHRMVRRLHGHPKLLHSHRSHCFGPPPPARTWSCLPHHQAHVVCLSFERRALPYMAAAISACTNAMAKLAQVTMVVMCPLASHVGSLWNVRTPLAPPFAAGAASAGRSREPGRSLLCHRKDEDEGRRAQIREKGRILLGSCDSCE